MKNKGSTLFKVAGILAIVFGAICCLGFLAIFPLFVGVPLIIGGCQYLKYAELTDEEIKQSETAILVWTIVFFLTGILLGVLSLIGYLNITNNGNIIKNGNATQQNNQTQNETEVSGTINTENSEADVKIAKIERLNKLKEQGLISQEEYDRLKEELFKK